MKKAIVVMAFVCLFAMPALVGANDSHGGFANDSHGGFVTAPDSKVPGALEVSTIDSLSVALGNDSHGGIFVTVSYSEATNGGLSPTLQNLLFILVWLGLFPSFPI